MKDIDESAEHTYIDSEELQRKTALLNERLEELNKQQKTGKAIKRRGCV
ncbi:MAG: hypothetical protein GQ564_17215 [Bacteroidales bacterium]|nr:hypothetical protein [Bacteroidales bacterium]